MKVLVVYSSKTGNTRQIAEAIHEAMPEGSDIYSVEEAPNPEGYEFIAFGFWVDRGLPDEKARDYLKKIRDRRVGIFATLGAYPDSDHAQKVMGRAYEMVGAENVVLGHFICQGKIDPALIEKFKKLPPSHPHAMNPEREARHREASKHPNREDKEAAKALFSQMLAGSDCL